MPTDPAAPARRWLGASLAALAASLAAAGVAAAQNARVETMESGEIARLDAWSVAAIGRNGGALPVTLWNNSDAQRLAALFDALPARFQSPAALSLARRALASSGRAPRGDAADAARKRFEALGRIGLADDLATMAGGAVVNDPLVAQFAAQAELARGRAEEACRRARGRDGEEANAFTLRLRAYCAALDGETAAADLALEMARAARADDAWFRAVINAMAAPPARPPAARYDTSLNASVSLAASLPAGRNPLASSSSLALVTVSRSDRAAPGVRMQAAALAAQRGVVAPLEARRAILAAIAADPEARLPALAAAVRQAETARGDIETARAIAAILGPASDYGDFAAASRLFADDIAALQAAPDAASALAFARAAAAAGDLRLAARLVENAADAGVPPPLLAQLRAAIAVGAPQPQREQALIAQRRLENAPPGAAAARALSRDLAIMAALSYPLSDAAQAHLAQSPPQGGAAPSAEQTNALITAVEMQSVGEVAVASAMIAAPGVNRLDAATLTAIIQALRMAGLDDAAREIALEAMISGPPS
ncbi:MAG: hypothetical protein GC206_05455 [Alphaproteobacteria bacterium]|nr:hypothetical protein [Alphaproteobacteria bacterium]